jgi:hypothetical protein
MEASVAGRQPYRYPDDRVSNRVITETMNSLKEAGRRTCEDGAGSLSEGLSELVTFSCKKSARRVVADCRRISFRDGLRQVGVENLGQLGGVRARGAVSAPNEAVNPHLGDREIDLPGTRQRSGRVSILFSDTMH